ncbi:hypothetical protein ACIBL6_15890 [Streptomyces sp. NPDC050400]|uniref:hypothetical protein n=1 Tax=Streptomyces sp. NPDC050400 TaxID=3365610 RepID=UPI0037B4B02C
MPAQEKVHYALTDVLAVLGIFLPPPKPWSDMCTALYLVHTEEYVDTGQLGTWVQCELDACHPADTHEGEDIEWSDNQPGAVMAWPVEP